MLAIGTTDPFLAQECPRKSVTRVAWVTGALPRWRGFVPTNQIRAGATSLLPSRTATIPGTRDACILTMLSKALARTANKQWRTTDSPTSVAQIITFELHCLPQWQNCPGGSYFPRLSNSLERHINSSNLHVFATYL
jgi:hypothetical protein